MNKDIIILRKHFMCSEWRVIMKRLISLDKLIVICLFLSAVPLLIATISIYFMPNDAYAL